MTRRALGQVCPALGRGVLLVPPGRASCNQHLARIATAATEATQASARDLGAQPLLDDIEALVRRARLPQPISQPTNKTALLDRFRLTEHDARSGSCWALAVPIARLPVSCSSASGRPPSMSPACCENLCQNALGGRAGRPSNNRTQITRRPVRRATDQERQNPPQPEPTIGDSCHGYA